MKYFLISDIHSFYEPMMEALKKAGFDETNKRHVLCVLGDVFDRGPDTIKVYEFLKGIPEERLILIRGNHEDLYEELLGKYFPQSHDFSNGTVKTFCHIANLGITDKDIRGGYIERCFEFDFEKVFSETQRDWEAVVEEVKKSEITKWIKRKSLWKNFYEIDNYILTHSFIPLKLREDIPDDLRFFVRNSAEALRYDPNWREGPADWEEARWGNPIALYSEGLLKEENDNGKVLVCGHWHSFGFREVLDGVKYSDESEIDFSIYYSKDIVAIDACTALSGICNVMVIDSEQGEI